MSSGERSVLSPHISTWEGWGLQNKRKKNRGWVIGKLRGASIFSTCLASPLSTALTAEHVSDPREGALSAFLSWLMSGSSQGSAVSSRGAGLTEQGDGASSLDNTCRFMSAKEVQLAEPYMLIIIYFQPGITAMLSLKLDVLKHLCLWKGPCELQHDRQMHAWLMCGLFKGKYTALLMAVINECKLEITARDWHD